MTDMAELKKRKVPLNLAIVHVDPEAFIANGVMPRFCGRFGANR